MNNVQRIIKYLSMAFAIYLALSIIFGIMQVVFVIGNTFSSESNSEKLDSVDLTGDASVLDINIKSSNLIIKNGTSLSAENINSYINIKQEENKIYITEESHNWFSSGNNDQLILYIPSNMVFDSVSIESGAGKITINELITKKLYFNFGAGKVDIKNIIVSDNAKINGGAGKMTIDNGSINNLKLELSVGKVTISSRLTGENKVESGIGEVNLNLIGQKDNYKINVNKGIGNIKVDGINLGDNATYGIGNTLVDIEGGIGSIEVNFIN